MASHPHVKKQLPLKIKANNGMTESELYHCDRIVLKSILWQEMANKRCRPITFKNVSHNIS
jgi:hypothetical protein